MLHACFISTFLCFVYTLRYFYTFSRTNLLRRCHSASCLFSAIFGFRKASKEIFSELDRTKAQVNISPEGTSSPEGRRRGEPGQPHLVVAWPALAAPPGGVLSWWVPLGHSRCPSAPFFMEKINMNFLKIFGKLYFWPIFRLWKFIFSQKRFLNN